jgi:hypothetical protein
MGGGLPSMLFGPYPIATGAPFLASMANGGTYSVVQGGLTRNVQVNNNTVNASANASNSFDITVLESQSFYAGLLSPVDLPTLKFFIRQNYEPELLFWLCADAVRESVHGQEIEYRNDPDDSRSCQYVP